MRRIESEHLQDAVVGLFFTLIGAAAVYWSTEYSGASGFYPRLLGATLTALGAFLVLRSARRSKKGVTEVRKLADSPPHLFTAITISVAYLAFLPTIGFYSTSLVVIIVLPVALGFRRAVPLLLGAILFIAGVYFIVSVFLKRPLPREFFQTI